ncbi:MAG: hypothetical protein WBA84_03980 [Carnobacterium sp.]|uniref:hypothetical protein n=1 Tax=Carnobacterium sp. TaxID=48221 RepID=UPI003C72F322
MQFNKKMDVLAQTKVSDGMGGWIVSTEAVDTLDVLTAPVKAEIAMKEYGIITTTSLKVFTKGYLLDEYSHLIIDEKKYKTLQLADYGKIRMLLVEEIQS